MLALEELVELELSVQESLWANYELTRRDNPELLCFIAEPPPKRTAEQIRAQLVGDAYSRTMTFSMRTVTTGARRNWKRGK